MISQQAHDVAALVRAVLGTDLIGAYLHGSAVLGGLRPRSDVDVLAVSRRSATPEQRHRLVDGLLDISGRRARRGPDRPVELIVVVLADVRPWRYPPTCDFLYGEWLRDRYERGELPQPAPSPDLAPLLTMALAGDTPLFGPPPADLLDPVPPADLRHAIVAGIPGLLADLADDTRNVVLTFARIWVTLATGEIRSKDAAADWAMAHLAAEHQPVLAHAKAIYVGQVAESWDDDLFARVRPAVDQVLVEIDRLTPGGRGWE
ncbi:aminoglycoside adenylyltransferase family protein [Catellatospora coxensis]|uniref:Nucleotidyltransferase n=1 Tax=Catellatospora coxensis TaxID=310354 RepID=A0A8J3KUF2_9ACTN|nr:aminoglycoside adenylyltransferase family protein [Catellatospora coxensis]GIG05369.1 nucleotidyltransferase [Catellatospora coxensis]